MIVYLTTLHNQNEFVRFSEVTTLNAHHGIGNFGCLQIKTDCFDTCDHIMSCCTNRLTIKSSKSTKDLLPVR